MYPLRFRPILKRHIWGGQSLLEIKKGQIARADKGARYGESWDISGMKGNVSVVSNGILKGNNLRELIEVYMGDLVGEGVFERYGLDFPLLFKYLACDDRVSVQVHPNDDVAAERHGTCGKSEMWYIVSAAEGAKVYIGFRNPNISREEYIRAVAEGRVEEIIQPIEVKAGDAFYIPAGTVHSISGGVVAVEIQQPADLTYRIFDWNRVDVEGRSRELHTAQAIDAIDFASTAETCRRDYVAPINEAVSLVKCDYFTTNLIVVDGSLERDNCERDSFVAYVCVEGEAVMETDETSDVLCAGDVILVPSAVGDVEFTGKARLIECYIE